MTVKTVRLALIGFGTVGQGFVDILRTRKQALADNQGFQAEVVAVSTLRRGAVYQPDGLDLDALLEAMRSGNLSQYPDQPGLVRGLDALDTIRKSNADCVIEVSPTDLSTAEPALSHIKASFEAGKHVVLANKGPIALAYREIADLAASKGLYLGFEATVMGGTPAIRLAQKALAGCRIQEIRGILNGTTNYILTQMDDGVPYAAALKEAQRSGYAEADPSGDVEGHDAAGKLLILVNTVLGGSMRLEDIERIGITHLKSEDIESAHINDRRWKLIARAWYTDSGLLASVKPEELPLSDPLANVSGVNNAVTYLTDLLGPVTLIGPGAGGLETGFAILSDLLHRFSDKR